MVKRLQVRLTGNSSFIRQKEVELQQLANELDKGILSWSEMFSSNPKFYAPWYKLMGVVLEEDDDKT